MSAKFKLKLSLADQIRLDKLVSELGKDKESSVALLVHDFFCGKGVKNPSRKPASR